VYSVAIDRRFLNPFLAAGTSPSAYHPVQTLVFDAWTRNSEQPGSSDDVRQVFAWMREQEPALPEDSTFRAFLRMNRERQRLPTLFTVPVPYEVFEGAGRRHPPCAPFRRSHPSSSGIISFSRVGFNERRTEALVYAEEWCAANELGRGFWLVLRRSSSGWTIVRTFWGFNAD
jgi:hypothetical protein